LIILEKTLLDFSKDINPDTEVITDEIMGGSSNAYFEQRERSLVFSGEVSLQNNGGFASGYIPVDIEDISGNHAFKIRVHGDGRQYGFSVKSDLTIQAVHRFYFDTYRQWQEISIYFDQFSPYHRGSARPDRYGINLKKIQSVGFMLADKKDGPFELLIDWIKLL